jgi:uncharacterized protein
MNKDIVQKYRKRIHTLFVEKVGKTLSVDTLEGPVRADSGDMLIYGLKGEKWPTKRETFEQHYRPVQGTILGETGYYETIPVEVQAYQTDTAQQVKRNIGSEFLQAMPGDWIVSGDNNNQWVVRSDIFDKSYEAIVRHDHKMHSTPNESQKKLLTIDGGGVRGIMSLAVLSDIERCLRVKTANPDLVLSDYFDYVGGTSAGSVIASCIALGMPVDDIITFFEGKIDQLFTVNPNFFRRLFKNKYARSPMVQTLKTVFGKDTTLGSDKLKTLLMVVLLNASSASPWPLSSNPHAKYNQKREDNKFTNLDILLWQIVRASTAAPYYFQPEVIDVGSKHQAFYDGGLTALNNPSMKLFQMATHPDYNLNWEQGKDKLLLVSVGSGYFSKNSVHLVKGNQNIIRDVTFTLESLIFNSTIEIDLSCRSLSNVIYAGEIDLEVGNMSSNDTNNQKAFSYIRYDPQLNQETNDLLSDSVDSEDYQVLSNLLKGPIRLDDTSAVKTLKKLGAAYAKSVVKQSHFQTF